MKRMIRLPRTAMLLLAWLYFSSPAHAQNATWIGTTSDWNTGTNWTPIPPGTLTPPTGTAEFGTPGVKTLTLSSTSTVENLVFNVPGYSFNFIQSLTITGTGITGNAPSFELPGGNLQFTNSSTAGPAIIHVFGLGPLNFFDMSNAGHATINAGIAGSTNGDTGGFVHFLGNSSAANAAITSFFGSNIEFHDTSKAGNATLTADIGGSIFFENASSADHATIRMLPGSAELSFSPAFFGGGTATAGNATIINNGTTNFYQGSSGGNATITTNEMGVTRFFGESTGGNAAFITNAGGIVDISGLGTFPDGGSGPNVPGMTAGSIEGAGTYNLGSKELTVGSNNLSTTVSGLIEGNGGSLVKVGTGTLTLTDNNTYSGGTTIQDGTLVVGTPSAAQEISFALGTGDVFCREEPCGRRAWIR